MSNSIFTDGNRPEHLGDKYRVYALRFEDASLLKVHVRQQVGFKTFCETYILQHIELATKNSKLIFKTSRIVGIEKIPNTNKPDFEVTMEGHLLEIA